MITVTSPIFNRIMISVFGLVSLMLACIGPTLLFPVGFIFFCAGLPLSVVFFLWAWVPQTRFDATGVTQRSLFFQTKTLAWAAVEKVRLDSYTRESRDSAGWTHSATHRTIELQGGPVTIYLNVLERDTTAWYSAVIALIRQQVSAEKIA